MEKENSLNIYQKLIAIQSELKAPKSKNNDFGKYKYRSLEDILEAVKPLLKKYDCTLFLQDTVEVIGDRTYIVACATFVNCEDGKVIETECRAREAIAHKGMDESQVTGTASSYARKYCLNGLFLIDDTKDADTNEFYRQTADEKKLATGAQKRALLQLCNELGEDPVTLAAVVRVDGKMTEAQYLKAMEILKEKKNG